MIELKETHQQGHISIENIPDELYQMYVRGNFSGASLEGDFGIQIAKDGRVWICINGIAFLRFKPTKTKGVIAKCSECGLEYDDPDSLEQVRQWIADGYAPCPNIGCKGQMDIVGTS